MADPIDQQRIRRQRSKWQCLKKKEEEMRSQLVITYYNLINYFAMQQDMADKAVGYTSNDGVQYKVLTFGLFNVCLGKQHAYFQDIQQSQSTTYQLLTSLKEYLADKSAGAQIVLDKLLCCVAKGTDVVLSIDPTCEKNEECVINQEIVIIIKLIIIPLDMTQLHLQHLEEHLEVIFQLEY
ncbi:MAG: hypothetical protein EZS28_039928 [Streblomastix strix]|uniref:Uncharacterized protein n=1 Tax=Streblomastix strix TaxID=222440 RepID=A0A5J4U4F8_9EUKA|nr:MAG: hypothetical protein EZS28_039928 [Streblomastix strix]